MSKLEQSPSHFAYHTGRMLGKYQLLRLIDRGGMAEVYKSYHPELERDLAVKILYPHFTDVPGFVERFRREAKAAAALRHPNIIQIFDFDHTEDGLYYMVLEYIDGQSLEGFLQAQAPLTLAQTLSLFRQIASAIQYAHEHGLIHRDIKPANVMLDKKGQAYLTDFGIAQIVGMSRLTRTNTSAGTPVYMAPEQVQSQPVTATADVYSLGMLLYKMLTNRLPYEGDNPTLMMVRKLTEPPTPPRQFKPDLPLEVEQVLLTALAPEPENRFPDVVSMTWALEEAYGALPEMILADTAVAPTKQAASEMFLNRLDHYEIQEELAHSETALSCRYVAHNQLLDRPAILEVLKVANGEGDELFLRRMTAVSQLDHPHIAPVTYIHQTADGRWYAALDHTPGHSLAARMQRETMTSVAVLAVARQVAAALQTIHAINLVHGDLGPETIFLGEEGQVWLMGLGGVVGTPSIQDNIQAFGRLLQNMLAGRNLSQPLSSIMANCLTASYDSMTAVLKALEEALAADPEQQPASWASSPMLPIIGVVFVLALVTVFVVMRLQPETAVTPLPTPSEVNVAEETAVQPTATLETIPTPTTSVSLESVPSAAEIEPGDIRLVSIVYNPEGDDAEGEYVVIENRGVEAISLTNWRLEDGASRVHVFNFPPFMLAAGAQVNIWTGRGTNGETDIYWGSGAPIWNNDGDIASLYDDVGTLVARCLYMGGEETAVCE